MTAATIAYARFSLFLSSSFPNSLKKQVSLNGGGHDDEFQLWDFVEDELDDEGEKVVFQFSFVDFVENEMRAAAKHLLRMMSQGFHHIARCDEEKTSRLTGSIVLADAIAHLTTWS